MRPLQRQLQRQLQRPNPLPLGTRLRSDLLQVPPFALATMLCGSAALMASLFDRSGRLQHRIARLWARLSMFFAWSPVTVIGAEHLRATGPLVYAANHTSYMDTPVVFSSIPSQFRILAKIELWKTPFIGWYLNRSGQIPIDTANPRATLSSLAVGVRALKAGMPLFVFPEGGRTPDGELQTFLNGAAFLAVRAHVPLVPVALIGVRELLPMKARHLYPRPVTLVAGAPIDTTGRTMREVDEVTAELKARIAAMVAAQVADEAKSIRD